MTTGLRAFAACVAVAGSAFGQTEPTFEELKRIGAARSSYLREQAVETRAATPDLDGYRTAVRPILAKACFECHGPEEDEAGLRLDTLDPDLFAGDDVEWWVDVLAVLTNGEMPPADEGELSDAHRRQLVDWLSLELQSASATRRAEQEHTAFRRLTRYEYGYALQDLLGLPFAFEQDLPPDPASEDGFRNSSETLHLTAGQLQDYLASSRRALRWATVSGERPTPIFWDVSMTELGRLGWSKQEQARDKLEKKLKDDPEKLQAALAKQLERDRKTPGGAHFVDGASGRKVGAGWQYGGARHAQRPVESERDWPEPSDVVAVVPSGGRLYVELGDRIPEAGTLRFRVRLRLSDEARPARLRLDFGWQASNDSRASVTIGDELTVDAAGVVGWEAPLSQVTPRNGVRGINKLGDLPSPSEFLQIVNAGGGSVEIDHIQVAAPVYEQWPPASHVRVLLEQSPDEAERDYARRVLTSFMERAWRRPIQADEVARKLTLFDGMRKASESTQDALLETLASVLTSPQFLYVVAEPEAENPERLAAPSMAMRLAAFLWCSIPDEALMRADLGDRSVVASQVERMLADPRAQRFGEQFVHQWLNLEMLEFLEAGGKSPLDPALKQAMLKEPIELFAHLLDENRSVLDLVHADHAIVNERLARHYGLAGVTGSQFQKVPLPDGSHRGGLLTQAGLLAMNSTDGESHPIRRAVWLMERILDDPPPPPPPAVPEIDLADPEIAKMTLKQRLEDHRNHAACMSCHARIDAWGFAFENYDALGSWRTKLKGQPVDASGELFNGQRLDGVDGLKRYLLSDRQDQIVRAMVSKLATFALGRPLSFSDRAAIDEITARVRSRGDGLATIVTLIATSDLFATP